MPAGDGTGPMGAGPMTGRGLGYCSGFQNPGFANPGFGRGFAGRVAVGFGRGRGNRFWARATGLPGWYRSGAGYPAFGGWTAQQAPAAFPVQQPEDVREPEVIQDERQSLRKELSSIAKRLSEIEKQLRESSK